jgi:CRISPR-associated exonuclease Cas4
MKEGVKELERAVNSEEKTDFKVTGISIQYASVCKRELWFYLHGVDINRDNPHIATGSDVDSRFYQDAESQVIDSMIAPDILEDGRIIEVKPSSTNSCSSENQLLYYMWYLSRFYDIKRSGVLAYPTERKRESVELTDQKITKIKELIQTVYEMYQSDEPPEFEEKPVCESCAYKEFCQIE